jgi:hypothetical protein
MFRFAFTCLLIGSWCHTAFAAESAPSAKTPRYVATVRLLQVESGKLSTAVETEVTGVKGTPLKTNLASKGLVLKLDMRDVPGDARSQYVAQFSLVESKQGKQVVLSAPTITTTAGVPGKLTVSQEKGDRIEVDLTVREVVPASIYGNSLMTVVTPRIIQDDEEDKMEVTSGP